MAQSRLHNLSAPISNFKVPQMTLEEGTVPEQMKTLIQQSHSKHRHQQCKEHGLFCLLVFF